MIRLLAAMALVLIVGLSGAGMTHELRPGFLEIQQTAPETYNVRFKVPARGNLRFGRFSGHGNSE